MSHDNSQASLIEQWMAEQIAAIQVDDQAAFQTADVWRNQIHALAGGGEAIQQYAPFAFTMYDPAPPDYQGDMDLNFRKRFSVLIGQYASQGKGQARLGSATMLGTNRLEEMVVVALDKQHPTGTTADDLLFDGSVVVFDHPNACILNLFFKLDSMES